MIIGQIKENTVFSSKNSKYSTVLQPIEETKEERQLCWLFPVFQSILFSFFLS